MLRPSKCYMQITSYSWLSWDFFFFLEDANLVVYGYDAMTVSVCVCVCVFLCCIMQLHLKECHNFFCPTFVQMDPGLVKLGSENIPASSLAQLLCNGLLRPD